MSTGPAGMVGGATKRQPGWRRFLSRPSTPSGWRSVGLAGCFMVLLLIVSIGVIGLANFKIWLPVMVVYVFFLMLCGLLAAIAGLAAVIRHGERSWLVWLSLLLGLLMFSSALFEFLVPH